MLKCIKCGAKYDSPTEAIMYEKPCSWTLNEDKSHICPCGAEYDFETLVDLNIELCTKNLNK